MRTSLGCVSVALLALAGHGWAYSSLVVGPAQNTATLNIPAVAPFTQFGDYRVEFRIHDWGATADRILSWGSTYGSGSYLEIRLRAVGEICAVNYVDHLPRGQWSCANVVGHNDVLVRVQRIGSMPTEGSAVGSFWLEAWDVDGTPLQSYCGYDGVNTTATTGCPISALGIVDWSQHTGFIGNPKSPTAFSLGWLKWFSTTVAPRGAFPRESETADLADWRFEENLTNQGTGGYGVSIGTFTAGSHYAASPSHAPACAAGASRTYRAGIPAQLDGTASQPLNGQPSLAYLWQQLSGPTNVSWSGGRDTASPWIGQTEFGTYIFRLTVTDSGGQSSTCTVKHGFVATDDDGVVITNNPVVDTLLGPMVRFGTNPWPWFDDRHKAEADMQAAVMDTYYPAWWDVPAAGTISYRKGSTAVVGTGTAFTTDFCQGPGSPTVPKTGARINIWYPNSSQQGYGVRMHAVASCQSDTALALSWAWGDDVADCAGGGCKYAVGGDDYVWSYSSAPANYYDAVAAFYALYYRTGIDDYLTAARILADRHWVHQLDSGTVCAGKNGLGGCGAQRWIERNISLLGMILRANDGRPDMWNGLHTIIAYFRDRYLAAGCPTCEENDVNWGLWDIREEAYNLAMVSYGALFSPDAGFRASCKAALSNVMNKLWNVTQDPELHVWTQAFANYASWLPGSNPAKTTVIVNHGSTSVVGNGTSWTSAVDGGRLVLSPTWVKPVNRQAHESTYYVVTYVDGTHLTLDRPYEGQSGTRGWMIGTTSATGQGVQPFIEGILGLAFEFTARAIDDTDPANARLARQHNADIANWQRTYGFRPANNGMQYFAGTVDCMPPISESWTWCTAGNNASQARVLDAEVLRSVMLASADSGDADLLAFGNTLYNAMFGKPGTCPAGSTVCASDGAYVWDLDDVWGYYMRGTPPTGRAHKYFGMFFGIGAGSDWPAFRLKTVPSNPRPARVGFNLQNVPGAASVRVVATAPSGETVRVSCSSSPCTIDTDERQGDYAFRIEYLSASGAVLATTKMAVPLGRTSQQAQSAGGAQN